jgi:protein SCO1/2
MRAAPVGSRSADRGASHAPRPDKAPAGERARWLLADVDRRFRAPKWLANVLLAAVPWLLAGMVGTAAADPGYAFRGIVSETRPRATDFTLTAHTGKRVRLSDFDGRLRLLYFGYTNCPGICPTTLAEVHQALRALEPRRAARVRVFLISVDPKRDTPERLGAHLSHFGPAFTGLTGKPAEIAAVAAAYGVYYRVTEGPTPADYLVDHTSMVVVIDEASAVRLLFPFGTSSGDMAADLRHLLP